jgi:hypothetical protein
LTEPAAVEIIAAALRNAPEPDRYAHGPGSQSAARAVRTSVRLTTCVGVAEIWPVPALLEIHVPLPDTGQHQSDRQTGGY